MNSLILGFLLLAVVSLGLFVGDFTSNKEETR
jgi:hypothetical protein